MDSTLRMIVRISGFLWFCPTFCPVPPGKAPIGLNTNCKYRVISPIKNLSTCVYHRYSGLSQVFQLRLILILELILE